MRARAAAASASTGTTARCYIDEKPNDTVTQGVICAKGLAAIMKQHSPARLTRPFLRKPVSERGAGEFEPASRESAFEMTRLATIRASDPQKFAYFTACAQMHALTRLFARRFGTPDCAAHGGFCSVYMAAELI